MPNEDVAKMVGRVAVKLSQQPGVTYRQAIELACLAYSDEFLEAMLDYIETTTEYRLDQDDL